MAVFSGVPAINIAAALSNNALQQNLARNLRRDAFREILRDTKRQQKLDTDVYQRVDTQIDTENYEQCVVDFFQEITKITSDHRARNDKAVGVLRSMQAAKTSDLKGVVASIVEEAQQFVTELLEIDELVDVRIDDTVLTFAENLRNVDGVLSTLFSRRLITDEDHRKALNLPDDGAKRELFGILRKLSSTEHKLAFIEILRENNNKHVADAIIRPEDQEVIVQKKEKAIKRE